MNDDIERVIGELQAIANGGLPEVYDGSFGDWEADLWASMSWGSDEMFAFLNLLRVDPRFDGLRSAIAARLGKDTFRDIEKHCASFEAFEIWLLNGDDAAVVEHPRPALVF